TGFGPINLLPGIADFTVDTAITLPIGLETYAAYSMYAWLAAAHLSTSTRRFAKWSALGSLVLGMAGQAAYHVMASQGTVKALVEIVIVVSAIPVIVLGLGTGLAHAMRKDWHAYQATLQVARADAGTDMPEVPDVAPVERHVPEVPNAGTDVPEVPATAPVPIAENVPAPAPRGKPKSRPVNTNARDLSTNERYRIGLEAYHRAVVVTGRKL